MNPAALQRYFRSAGYMRVPGVIDPFSCSELNEVLDQEFKCPAPHQRTIYAAGGVAVKLYGILQRPYIGRMLHTQLASSGRLSSTLKALLGPNVSVTLNRHNHATNNYTGENTVRMHRDVLQPSRSIVSALLYLDRSDDGNGATRVVPGSHLEPFVGTPQSDGGGTWMDEHEEFDHLHDQAVSVNCEPGDMLLFDGTLFHTLSRNLTGDRRRSVALGFKAIDELSGLLPEKEALFMGQDIYRGNDD